MSGEKSIRIKMIWGIATIILLLICLTLTTFGLVYATLSIEENIFHTGRVKINLNDGEPIIREDEFLFEPGMTVQKEFFIENLSTWEVYYKIYFDNVDGGLSDVLQITVTDGSKILCSGTMADLSKDKVVSGEEPLSVMERKNLTVIFRFPKDAGNKAQGMDLKFDLCADAVQTKNNPDRAFE